MLQCSYVGSSIHRNRPQQILRKAWGKISASFPSGTSFAVIPVSLSAMMMTVALEGCMPFFLHPGDTAGLLRNLMALLELESQA